MMTALSSFCNLRKFSEHWPLLKLCHRVNVPHLYRGICRQEAAKPGNLSSTHVVLKRAVGLFLLVGVVQLLTPSVYAQTVLNFPRVISNSSLFTGLAVGNPTTTDVSVTFTAVQPDGTTFAAAGIQNP